MTYTEFIIEVENNIAKANCNKLNMEEYEEKQKQIYKQIRADAIDDFRKEICKMITQSENDGNYRFYACEIKQSIADLAERLKAGVKMEEVITLKQLSNVQNWIGKGVRIAFCLDEYSSVTNKIDLINFKQIKEQISNPEKFRIFRIDSLDDLICVYVIEIAEKGVEING